jgi:hypothetical protein
MPHILVLQTELVVPHFFRLYNLHFTFKIALRSSVSESFRILSYTTREQQTYHNQQWTLAAAAAVGLVGGSVLTFCEQRQPLYAKLPNGGGLDSLKTQSPEQQYALKKNQTTPEKSSFKENHGSSILATSTTTATTTNASVDVTPLTGAVEPVMTPAEQTLEAATRKAKQHSGGLKVFSGNGNMSLALEITRHLGINLGKATVGKFADGETNVVIHENVRGKDVYIVQPTGPPVNDNMMELLLMTSTLRRASARRITVVIPYYGYARQDRKMQVRAFGLESI